MEILFAIGGFFLLFILIAPLINAFGSNSPHKDKSQDEKKEQALKDIKKLRVTTIIQTDLYDSEDRNHKILGAAQMSHIQYNFIPGEPEFYTGKNTIDVFLGYPMITVSQTPLIGWGAILKRVFDFVVSIILLVPLLLLPWKLFASGSPTLKPPMVMAWEPKGTLMSLNAIVILLLRQLRAGTRTDSGKTAPRPQP